MKKKSNEDLYLNVIRNKLMTRTIIASNETIRDIVRQEIEKHGKNASLNHIDVSDVTDMSELFAKSDFDGDISGWDVSDVKDMSGMFADSEFTGTYGDISYWNVSNVEGMSYMFANSKYNGDLFYWDVSNVKCAQGMFMNSPFNSCICNWNLRCDESGYCDMFTGCDIPEKYKPVVCRKYNRFCDTLIELLEELSESGSGIVDNVLFNIETPEDERDLNDILNFLRENFAKGKSE